MADATPGPAKRKRRQPWLWVILALIALFFIGWLFGPLTVQYTRREVAHHYAHSAAERIAKSHWSEAFQDISVARRWAPDDPEVLRVLADFMIQVKSDSFSIHHLLLRLADAGKATTDDLLRIAEFQLTQGDVTRARATLASLPQAERRKRRAQEILANILRVEGRQKESDEVLRAALRADPEDRASRLRLAMLDYTSPFSEIRARSRDQVWDLSHGSDDTALQAIQFLSAEPALTFAQADDLLASIEKFPKPAPEVRLRVLSAIMRLHPESRQRVLDRETAHYDGDPDGAGNAILQWLITEEEFDRVLKLVPEEKSESASGLDFRLKALAGKGDWAEVEKTLNAKDDSPLPAEAANLWHARAVNQLYHDPARTRHFIEAAFNSAGMGEKGEATLDAARFAEECGLWRVAATCYRGIARAHPASQIKMLEKVFEMSLRNRDTSAAVDSARTLVEQNPANRAFAARLAYYRLVTGTEMEMALWHHQQMAEPADAQAANTESVVGLLCAYRLHDTRRLEELVSSVGGPDGLSPGERSVFAGMLALAGKPAQAYRLAEKIPAGLLLPEEMAFLKRAL